jgi:hypothetical protein
MMPAHIKKPAQGFIVSPDDQNRFSCEVGRDVLAGG